MSARPSVKSFNTQNKDVCILVLLFLASKCHYQENIDMLLGHGSTESGLHSEERHCCVVFGLD